MLDAPPASSAAPPGRASFTIAIRPDVTRVTVAPSGDLDLFRLARPSAAARRPLEVTATESAFEFVEGSGA